jgi:hypothetical protein
MSCRSRRNFSQGCSASAGRDVSGAAGELQRSGLISYRRGMITVTNRARLEKTACECYQIAKQRIRRPL